MSYDDIHEEANRREEAARREEAVQRELAGRAAVRKVKGFFTCLGIAVGILIIIVIIIGVAAS